MTTEILSHFAARCANNGFFGFPTWYKYLEKDEDKSAITGGCEISFSLMDDGKFNGSDLLLVSLSIVDILTRVAALIAVFFVIYGGIRYITSQGSPEGVKAAQNTIMNAMIGLAIAIISAAFVAFLGNLITT